MTQPATVIHMTNATTNTKADTLARSAATAEARGMKLRADAYAAHKAGKPVAEVNAIIAEAVKALKESSRLMRAATKAL